MMTKITNLFIKTNTRSEIIKKLTITPMHNMGAFFSGTDISEICDNATNFNYYISLVLDFKKEYKCKIAFPSATKINKKYSIKDDNGNIVNLISKVEQTEILIGDLDIEIDVDIPWLNKRITELKNESRAIAVAKTQQNSLFPDNYQYGNATYNKPVVRNVSLTDTQFTSILLNMDTGKKDISIYSTLKNICSLDIEELGIYEESLDMNLKRLYLECYPLDTSFSKLSEKCLNSLLEVSKLKVFEDEVIVISIKEILKSYV